MIACLDEQRSCFLALAPKNNDMSEQDDMIHDVMTH